jgi:hypothetical protein
MNPVLLIDLGFLELKNATLSDHPYVIVINYIILIFSIINHAAVVLFYLWRKNIQPVKSRSALLIYLTLFLNLTLSILCTLKILMGRNNMNCVVYHFLFSIFAPRKKIYKNSGTNTNSIQFIQIICD